MFFLNVYSWFIRNLERFNYEPISGGDLRPTQYQVEYKSSLLIIQEFVSLIAVEAGDLRYNIKLVTLYPHLSAQMPRLSADFVKKLLLKDGDKSAQVDCKGRICNKNECLKHVV